MAALRENDLVFPGQKQNKPISAASIEMLLRRMQVKQFGDNSRLSEFVP